MSAVSRSGTQPYVLHSGDRHDLIRVQGARENNLKNIQLELPKRRLTVLTSVSGSGKSSLVSGPTSSLHLADVEALLDRFVGAGLSVIVIEHHQAVMAHADWIIDLGPGAGHDGGRIVFEDTPANLIAARATLTGAHLARYVTC